ncbi:MAG: tyrosine--tRNA ligase [Candidatus Yanofskybacteria bacterium]|nr:tyrosine--tRNA ligase [Candidatus Yanofskybacteria bacterium]
MFGLNKKSLVTDKEAIREAFDRRTGDIGRRLENDGVFPNVDEAIKILGSRRCIVYLGIDPTGPDIHLGHTIPILFLKQLWKLGHTPVLVIGDFTARIGDPTGKESARKPLTEKEVRDNMKNYLSQIYKILPRGSFEVKYNSSWLAKMSFGDVIKLASNVTVQQMLQRDMFQKRLDSSQPIGLHEFLYPLMQGYDSVVMNIDGEVGGNDQTFNMLVGRDLEKKLVNKDKLVFATQLLVDATTGKKMSKSEGGLISLSDTPGDMFGKTMAIPDGFIRGMFKLCTEKSMKWIDEHDEDIKTQPYVYKKELAFELVKMYYGENEAKKAQENFAKVFSEGKNPDEIREIDNEGDIVKTLAAAGGVTSNSEARRLIEQKAVRVNDVVVENWDHKLESGDIIKVGPRKFLKIK